MNIHYEITDTCNIEDLQDDRFILVTNSQDVAPITEHFACQEEEFDSYLVDIGDGDYVEVWGFYGIAYLYKTAYKIELIHSDN